MGIAPSGGTAMQWWSHNPPTLWRKGCPNVHAVSKHHIPSSYLCSLLVCTAISWCSWHCIGDGLEWLLVQERPRWHSFEQQCLHCISLAVTFCNSISPTVFWLALCFSFKTIFTFTLRLTVFTILRFAVHSISISWLGFVSCPTFLLSPFKAHSPSTWPLLRPTFSGPLSRWLCDPFWCK